MKKKKIILGLLTVLFSVSVSSCDRKETPWETPEETSISKINSEVEGSVGGYSLRSFSVPTGWKLRDSGVGVQALQRGNENVWVVVADLSKGAKFGCVFDPPSVDPKTSDVLFKRKRISSWDSYGTFFACSNALYFDSRKDPCRLPFPLRQEGKMFSEGNGGSLKDQSQNKVALMVYDEGKYAEAVSIGTSPMQTNLLADAKKAYVGFSYDYGNDKKSKIGRTFVGLRDDDADGKCELIFLLVVHGPRNQKVGLQHDAARQILSDDFSCLNKNIITFDGSGSSQLRIRGVTKVSGDNRTFPIAFVIKEGAK